MEFLRFKKEFRDSYRYFWVDEFEERFEGDNVFDVLNKIVKKRFELKMPEIEYLALIIEDYTIKNTFGLEGKIEKVNLDADKSFKLDMAVSGFLSLKNLILDAKSKKVSQDTANIRAKRCSDCFFNRNVFKGKTVPQVEGSLIRSLFARVRGESATPEDKELGFCMLCGCINKDKVWVKKEEIETSKDLKKQFEAVYLGKSGKKLKCWMVDEEI